MGQCIITYIVLDNVCTIQVQPERGGKLLWNNAKYAVGINKKCLQLWMCSGVSDKETKLQPSCQRWRTSTGTPVTESSTDFHCMQWSEEPFLWKTITASKNYLNGGLRFFCLFFFVLLKTQPKTVYITRSDGTIAQGNKIWLTAVEKHCRVLICVQDSQHMLNSYCVQWNEFNCI